MTKKALYAAVILTFSCLLIADTSIAATKKIDPKAGKKDFIYGQDPFESKFFHTANRIMRLQSGLKLTPDQIKKIRLLVAETRIKLRDRDEDIDTVTVALNTFMWENPFDVQTISRLTAERMNFQVEKQRFIVKSFKKLSDIMTPEQASALKTAQE